MRPRMVAPLPRNWQSYDTWISVSVAMSNSPKWMVA